MYAFKNIKETAMVDAAGRPLVDQARKPGVISTVAYVLAALSDAAFYAGIGGIDAMRLAAETKVAIEKQSDADSIVVSDDVLKRLQSFTKAPSEPFGARALLGLLPIAEAIMAAVKVDPQS